MKRIWKWLTTPLLLLVYFLFWLVVDLLVLGRSYGLDAGEWASWVQAVGSILAIAGGAWAALHTIANARETVKDNERQAAKSHLIFIRAVLTQASYAIDNFRDSVHYFNMAKIEMNGAWIAFCLTSIEAAIGRTTDEELTRILADAYERLSICRSHALRAAGPSGFDRANAEVTARVSKEFIDDLLVNLEAIARSWGMQPAPAA
jgi:putative Mn2+ efflux pump MntP